MGPLCLFSKQKKMFSREKLPNSCETFYESATQWLSLEIQFALSAVQIRQEKGQAGARARAAPWWSQAVVQPQAFRVQASANRKALKGAGWARPAPAAVGVGSGGGRGPALVSLHLLLNWPLQRLFHQESTDEGPQGSGSWSDLSVQVARKAAPGGGGAVGSGTAPGVRPHRWSDQTWVQHPWYWVLARRAFRAGPTCERTFTR